MPRKKIEPLFEEAPKTPVGIKKSSTPKVVVAKKETTARKTTVTKKEEPVKPLPKKKTSTPEAKKPPIKPSTKKEPKKVSPKKVTPPAKKTPTPRVKEVKIEEPEEKQIEIVEEKKPAYVKEPKRKPKIDKNAPPVNKKHTLKVGTRVIVTFLGQPESGIIIELTDEGMYKIKADRGMILPRAKYENGEIIDKKYPSYIIKIL